MFFPRVGRWFVPVILTAFLVGSCTKTPTTAPTAVEAQRAPEVAGRATSGIPLTAAQQEIAEAAAQETAKNLPKKTVKVGLLLPLTGRNAALGRAMQDAATVSLFDKYARLSVTQQAVQVQLLPKDTGDSPEFARAAMTSALKDGATLIIGPVFSDATEAAAPLANAQNINVLSFSNNRARGATGVYLLGFSPQDQAQRVVDYALQHDKKRIAIFVPRSPLGDEVIAGARAASVANGIALAAIVQYAPQAIGLQESINTLLPANGEGTQFDALLLAEGGQTLDTILHALSARGVTQGTTQFLGTGIWDDIALLKRVNLNGAWFASSPPEATVQFESRFRATYNYMPPRIASLAYDAVALAVTLATSDRAYTTDNLTNKGGFVGPANGIFRLRPGGTVERGLAVIQVDGSSLHVLSPAPTGFTK